MTSPLLAGLAVAAAAYAGRYGIQAWQAFKARPPTARMRKFYEGGFQPKMTRREAALILGVRESTPPDKVREAHRRVMVANHPDAGGSHYLASKINEAKDIMMGKSKSSGYLNAFSELKEEENERLHSRKHRLLTGQRSIFDR
ncbi:Mitochondrial import inner membrane translocase subunit TIM14-1 [Forsythia ovata]|uniref:Mitochondrial import inner membrane translocase subunit TIM14-1 n=1 Tax=Forsythia ovata TaxID=205694 RepID=A0ABD1T9E9_9LAMI